MKIAAGAAVGFVAGIASAAYWRRNVGALMWWLFTRDQRP